MLFNLNIGSTYDIPMLSPAVLGTKYSSATVMALLDYASAIQIADVSAIHASVLSALPTGTPSDASKLIYVKIKTSTGEITVLALNWISTQPTLVDKTTVTVLISNISQSDIPRLSQALNANGFNSFTIS